MIRPVLTELLLFLLPFVAYGIFLLATRQGVLDPASWPLPTLSWLAIAALVLMIGGFIALANLSGAPGDWIYIPAHVDENGNLVPGRTVPRPK
jgi:Family of unknown function (DUF6111)